jgi:hypothetical protein
MKNKILLLFLGYCFVLLFSAVSCIRCKSGKVADYKINGIILKLSDAKLQTDSAKNWIFNNIEDSMVNFKNYAIQIIPNIVQLSATTNKIPSFSILPQAFACSPREGQILDRIENIKITCNKDFDELHPAGTDLKMLFVVLADAPYSSSTEIISMSEFLTMKKMYEKFYFLLKSPPSNSDDFEFRVELFVDGIDYDYYDLKTKKVYLNI